MPHFAVALDRSTGDRSDRLTIETFPTSQKGRIDFVKFSYLDGACIAFKILEI